jgi:hypothetical protein
MQYYDMPEICSYQSKVVEESVKIARVVKENLFGFEGRERQLLQQDCAFPKVAGQKQ